MARRRNPQWTPVYDVYENFVGLAWRRHSSYTSYLFYVEPWGEC